MHSAGSWMIAIQILSECKRKENFTSNVSSRRADQCMCAKLKAAFSSGNLRTWHRHIIDLKNIKGKFRVSNPIQVDESSVGSSCLSFFFSLLGGLALPLNSTLCVFFGFLSSLSPFHSSPCKKLFFYFSALFDFMCNSWISVSACSALPFVFVGPFLSRVVDESTKKSATQHIKGGTHKKNNTTKSDFIPNEWETAAMCTTTCWSFCCCTGILSTKGISVEWNAMLLRVLCRPNDVMTKPDTEEMRTVKMRIDFYGPGDNLLLNGMKIFVHHRRKSVEFKFIQWILYYHIFHLRQNDNSNNSR